MDKLSVSEYARKLNVSVNTIYKKIKRGSINTVKEEGKIFVIVDDTEVRTEVKQEINSGCNELLKIIKRRDKEVVTLQKEIKRLTKKNEKINSFLIGKYEKALPVPKKEDVIVVKPKKSKKKKK